MWLNNFNALRRESGMSLDDISEKSGVPKGTLAKITSGQTLNPSLETMRALVYAMGYTLDDLEDEGTINHILSFEERAGLKKYRALDQCGKDAVKAILEIEHRRTLEQPREEKRVVDMMVFNNPSAAGIPMYADSDYERLSFPEEEVQEGADFGVRISGDSMEPTIADGSIVWVRAVPEIEDGHIGIFMIDDRSVCKRMRHDGKRIYLDSDNPEYEPILIGEFDRLGVVGLVLGYK